MKKILFTLLMLIVIVCISCKNKSEEPIKKDQVKEETVKTKQLTINFNFKTDKGDVFKIMMNNIVVDELQKKNIHIFEDVVPTSEEDAIVAMFDVDNISNSIVINLGNKEVKQVVVKSITISYGGSQFTLKTPSDFEKYVVLNRFVDRDSLNLVLKTKRVNGQHNPGFSFKRNLINQLRKNQ